MFTSMRRVALSLCYLSVLAGCTSVHIYDAETVKTTYYPGVANISIEAGEGVTSIDTHAIGAVSTGNSMSLGWIREERVVISDECVLVVLLDEKANLDTFVENLESKGFASGEICLGAKEKRE